MEEFTDSRGRWRREGRVKVLVEPSPGLVEEIEQDRIAALERAENRPPTVQERLEAIEQATGAGDEQGQRGIAKRLDAIEDRIAALEGK